MMYTTFKCQFELLPFVRILYGDGFHRTDLNICIGWGWFGFIFKIKDMAKISVKKKPDKKLPEYPADHKLGMEVPEGGSDCAKCSFWDGEDCENKYYREWNNGSGEIPVKPERYCCDFFQIGKK